MGLAIYVGLLFYFGYSAFIWKVFLFMPISITIAIITTFGLGTFLAALNVKYRDFQYVIPFMIQFLLFVNPVLYSTSIFKSPSAKYLLALNPMSTAIEISRAALNNTQIDMSVLIISCISMLVYLVLGIYTFRTTESYFADIA
jgi:lipopolysaccharide transport system permease protein